MRYPLLLLSVFFADPAYAGKLWVPAEFTTIQAAIDTAVDGDEVVVMPGTYRECIDFSGKEITVRSFGGRKVTTIDGNRLGSVVTFASGEGPNAILEGFTITNGVGTPIWTYRYGGGIYCESASPTLLHNDITANTADYGGGILVDDYASPTIRGNAIFENTGQAIYGDVYSSPDVDDNWISGNQGVGVEFRLGCQPTIRQNTISYNYGAGILLVHALIAAIQGNTIVHNAGSGIACHYASLALVLENDLSHNAGYGVDAWDSNCIVASCTILHNGGHGISGYVVDLSIENCCIAWNSGAGIDVEHALVEVKTCTIAHNTSTHGAGGIRLMEHSGSFTSCTVENSILWDNHGPEGPEIELGAFPPFGWGCTLQIRYSDVKGGQASAFVETNSTLVWGTGMIDAEPLFVASHADDFRLEQDPVQPGIVNPCVDSADPGAALVIGSTRTDWKPDEDRPDMGFHYLFPAASASFRNEGSNPASYTAVMAPVLGSTYDATVDLAGTTGHGFAVLAGFASPLNIPLPGGRILLCNLADPRGELLGWPVGTGPVASFSLPVPSDLTLVGFELYTQAIHLGPSAPFVLSNAQDLLVGF